MPKRRAGANGLMCVLGILLRLVGVRRFGQKLGTEIASDKVTHFAYRFIRHARRIGTHVGNESDRAFVAEVDAFVEALRQDHGTLNAEAQLARGVLLELAGSERRCRAAAALALVNRAHAPVGVLQGGLQFGGFFAIRNRGFLATNADKTRRKCRWLGGLQVRVKSPILFLNEHLDFAFALDDEPQRNRLHAAGGEPAADLVPQQWRNLVTNETIQYA